MARSQCIRGKVADSDNSAPWVPGHYVLHPIVLLSLCLWALNDHVLKGAWPGLVTGKLSDVVSLIAFPVLWLASWEQCWAWQGRPAPSAHSHNRVLLAGVIATGAVMATINIFVAAAMAYKWGLGLVQWPLRGLLATAIGSPWPGLRPVVLTMDPTDVFTLPALVVPLWIAWARPRRNGKDAEGKPGIADP